MEEEEIRVENLIEILKRRWRMITIITLITTILAVIFNFFIINPTYEASTKIFIGKEGIENKNYDSSDIQMYQNLLKTYSEVIKTNDLIEAALTEINTDIKSENVLKSLTVTPTADTQILEIKYENNNKFLCKNVVETITNEFIKESKKLIPIGNVTIIENVKLPKYPSGPKRIMNMAIAFFMGFIVAIGIAFLKEYLDNTFKNKEQLEKLIEIPVIGIIPIEE